MVGGRAATAAAAGAAGSEAAQRHCSVTTGRPGLQCIWVLGLTADHLLLLLLQHRGLVPLVGIGWSHACVLASVLQVVKVIMLVAR